MSKESCEECMHLRGVRIICLTCTRIHPLPGDTDNYESEPLADPARGDPKRCDVCGRWCVIASVSEKEWVPDWFCPVCHEQAAPEQDNTSIADCPDCAIREICQLTVRIPGCGIYVMPAGGERR